MLGNNTVKEPGGSRQRRGSAQPSDLAQERLGVGDPSGHVGTWKVWVENAYRTSGHDDVGVAAAGNWGGLPLYFTVMAKARSDLRLGGRIDQTTYSPGSPFVSNAIIAGRYVLRACIVNFHTERADVEALPEIVVRRGRALWAEQRKGGTA